MIEIIDAQAAPKLYHLKSAPGFAKSLTHAIGIPARIVLCVYLEREGLRDTQLRPRCPPGRL